MPGSGNAVWAGHAPPLRNKATIFTNQNPCGKQMPRPRRRAGIKSEKAGSRLKNRLIVIFEVKSGFFPPLWGVQGDGSPWRRVRAWQAHACHPACAGPRLRLQAVPAFGAPRFRCAQPWPHAPNPASPRTAGLFSVPLLVTKEEQLRGKMPFAAKAPRRGRGVPRPLRWGCVRHKGGALRRRTLHASLFTLHSPLFTLRSPLSAHRSRCGRTAPFCGAVWRQGPG